MKINHPRISWLLILVLILALFPGASAWAARVNLVVNPSFEHAYAAQRLTNTNLPHIRPEYRKLPGYQGEAFMPYGWAMVPQEDSQGIVSRVRDEGKPALRVRLEAGQTIYLRQQIIEVVPGADYTVGLSLKGSGGVSVAAWASEPGPYQQFCRIRIDSTPEWTAHSQKVKVGWHRHLAGLLLEISGKADLLLGGVEFSTESTQANSADGIFLRKPQKDADTLFYEGFDEKTSTVKPGGGAKLTDKDGGRFGLGLITTPEGGGHRSQLEAGELPQKGTVEFWFKPSSLPTKQPETYRTILGLATHSAGIGSGQLKFMDNSSGVLMLAFHNAKSHGAQEQAYTDQGTAWGWWRENSWHHLAGSWDGQALRFYVDGVLEGIVYPKGMEPPQGKLLDLLLPYAGVIDEIRISKVLRYGPIIPVGAEPPSFAAAATEAVPDKPVSAKEPAESELAAERAKLVSPTPKCDADYVIGMERFAPAWEGMAGVKNAKDYFGAGADGLEVSVEKQIGRAAYCRIEGIEQGEYYIGVWADTGDVYFRTEYSVPRLLLSAYVNGWPLRFSTTSDPVQLRQGLWVAELQSASPVSLKNGDEIAVCPHSNAAGQKVMRVALYRKTPARGHGVTGRTFGLEGHRPQRLRLMLEPEITGTGMDGDEHTATIRIANPLPYAVDAEVIWKLADYFGAPLVGKTETVHIEPHRVWSTSAKFPAKGVERAYQLDVKTRPAKGFKLPFPRPVEWLEYNDYTKVEFLPNLPSPLTAWNHVRKELIANRSDDRKALLLDGGRWESSPLDGRRVPEALPANLRFAPCADTQLGRLSKGQFGMWYRTKFSLPEWMKGQNCLLTFRGGPEATVFLNGKRIGCYYTGITGGCDVGPVEVSVSDLATALKADQPNELVVCLRGGVSAMNENYVDQFDQSDYSACKENQDRMADYMQIVLMHEVTLRTAPLLRVKQSMIVTDVEKQQLKIFTRVQNEDSKPRKVTLRFQVFQNGLPVKVSIPDQIVTVDAKSVKQVIVEGKAGELIPYTPWAPVLARLSTFLLDDAAKDKPIDRFDQRFGYRSVRIEGTGMLLNGKPVKLYGNSFRHSPELFEGQDGVDVARCTYELPTRPEEREFYDEIGYLVYVGMDVAANEASWKKLNNDKYWANAAQAVIEKAWDTASHPCMVGWSLSNESYHYAPYMSGKEAQDKLGERIHSVVRTLRKEIWPGYWCIADGDEDLGGRLDFCSFHYPNHSYRAYDFGKQSGTMNPAFGNGHAHYPPDCFYLNGTADAPRKGTKVAMNPDWEFGSNACGDTESFGLFGDLVGAVKEGGDRAALSSACQWSEPRGVNWYRFAVEAYRDMEAFVGGSYWVGILGTVAQDVAFSMPQQAVRYYSGRKFERRINIHDDQYAPGELTFQWKLLDQAGNAVQRKTIKENSTTAFLARGRITFDLPKVQSRTVYTLDMQLWKNGTLWGHEQRRLEVWPEPAPISVAGLGVFDPDNALAGVLGKTVASESASQFKKIAALDKPSLSGVKCLLIAPDVTVTDLPVAQEALWDFTREGGRTLILRQQDGSLLPGNITVEKRAYFSQSYVRLPDHPAMKGLRDLDFQMWNSDHLVCQMPFAKPTTGNMLSLVDSFHTDRQTQNSSWSEVLEVYLDKGSILSVQLPLVEKLDSEPMAAEMFKRLLACMKEPVYRRIDRRLAVLGRASDAVLTRLREVRAEPEFLTKPDPAGLVTLLDLDAQGDLPDAAALHAYVAGGGSLIVHRARQEHAAWLESLTGAKVRVQVQPYSSWVDRQVLDRRNGLVEGLNNLDLYWRAFVDGEACDGLWQVSNGVPKGQEKGGVLYVAKVSGAEDYLFPGGLVEVPVGKGRVIVDQLKWEMPESNMRFSSPTRVISTLLTNLGVLLKQPVPRSTLPPGVTYEKIDLSKLVNRGLADDKAGDGIGWADWGPDQDLRDFPTGDVNLGVPFHVTPGDKNCIALHASASNIKSLIDFPASVSIPVKKKNVAGLWFLHTGGWVHGADAYAWREIRYSDGSKEVITINDTNMADWNFGRDDFPKEEVTTTTVAWKRACKSVPVTRVYKTLWVNPHPRKEIAEVVITTRDLPEKEWRFVVHLAVTVAIMPAGPANPPLVRRDPKKSQAMLQEALKLLADNKTEHASVRLQEAVKADDQNVAAWKEWTSLAAKTAKADAVEALCRKWIAAMPKSYEAHNALAQCLEKSGKFADALAEYQKSLTIEWNQPPIVEAVKRVQKKLNP